MNTKTITVRINSTNVVSRKIFDPTYAKLADILAEAFGFSYKLLAPEDGEIGREFLNGSWTGIIGLFQRNEVDMAVSPLSISLNRAKVVKFSYPFQKTRITFATRKAEYTPELTAFLRPYSLKVWMFIVLCLIAMPFAWTKILHGKYSVKKAIFICYGTLVGQARHIKPIKVSDYVIMTCWIVAITILGLSYKTILLSFLTFPPVQNIRTIPELADAVAKGEYQCTSYPGTSIVGILARSTEPRIRIIGQNLMKNSGSYDILTVMDNMKSKMKPAFIGGENHLNPLKIKYIISDDELIPALLAIPMRKIFCCKAHLDKFINYVWASGLYKKLVADEGFYATLKSMFHSPHSHLINKERHLSVEDFKGIFISLIIGYFLSTVIFIFEVIMGKFKTFLPLLKKQKKNISKSNSYEYKQKQICHMKVRKSSRNTIIPT